MIGHFDIAFADLGPALVLAVPLVHAVRKANLGVGWTIATVAFCVVAMGVPIFGVTVGGYVRAYTGNISIISIVLLADFLARTAVDRELFYLRSRVALLALGVVEGALLYPWTLGAAPYDPYVLGFGKIGPAIAIIALALVYWFVSLRGAAVAILIAIVTFHLRLYDSVNLWDYLVDPWIVIFGLVAVLRNIVAFVFAHQGDMMRPDKKR